MYPSEQIYWFINQPLIYISQNHSHWGSFPTCLMEKARCLCIYIYHYWITLMLTSHLGGQVKQKKLTDCSIFETLGKYLKLYCYRGTDINTVYIRGLGRKFISITLKQLIFTVELCGNLKVFFLIFFYISTLREGENARFSQYNTQNYAWILA